MRGDVRDARALRAAVRRRRAGVPLRRAGGGDHQPGRSRCTTSRSTPAARSICWKRCARCRHPPPLIFTSTNKVYGGLEDVAAACAQGSAMSPTTPATCGDGVSARARPLDFHSPYGCSKGAADQYVLDYARSLRPARGGVPHELHLRPAPVRHRRPGLGRALPDPRARGQADHALRRRHAGARHPVRRRSGGRVPARAGEYATRSPGRRSTSAAARSNTISLLELLGHDRRAARHEARRRVRSLARPATSATTSPTRANSSRATGWAPQVERRARASSGCTTGCCEQQARRCRSARPAERAS